MKDLCINFKSTYDNYLKESSGIKNNTVREIDMSDSRFIDLLNMSLNNEYGYIRISLKGSLQRFTRRIQDVTFYKNLCIITWEVI